MTTQTKAELEAKLNRQAQQIESLNEALNNTPSDIHGAVDLIVDHFTDPAMRYNRELDEQVEVNTLAWVQEGVIGSIIYGLRNKRSYLEDQLRAENRKLEAGQRAYLNDELGLQAIERLIRFAENKQNEVTAVAVFEDYISETYKNLFGKEWAPYSKKTDAPRADGSRAADLEARMAALGVKSKLTAMKTDGETTS